MTSIMVGIICGVIGCFIILRGMALDGGCDFSCSFTWRCNFLYAWNQFLYRCVISGVLTAIGIGFISQNSRIKNDVSIGIMFTAAFALGIILITFMKSSTDLYHILFGNVLAVRPSDMWTTLVIGIFVLVSFICSIKNFLLVHLIQQWQKHMDCQQDDSLFFNDIANNGNSRFLTNSRNSSCSCDAHYSGFDSLLVNRSTMDHDLPLSWHWSVCIYFGIVFQLHL